MSRLMRSVSASVSFEGVLSDDLTQRRLRDLVDRRGDVLDRDDRLRRVDHPVVGHGGHVDADVVAGDDPLRLDRHGHDAHRDTAQHVDQRDDQCEPRFLHIDDSSETEQDTFLVLLDDAERHRHAEQSENSDDGKNHEQYGHGGAPLLECATKVRSNADDSAAEQRPRTEQGSRAISSSEHSTRAQVERAV